MHALFVLAFYHALAPDVESLPPRVAICGFQGRILGAVVE